MTGESQTFYRSSNGQDYLTAYDAEVHGKCIGKYTITRKAEVQPLSNEEVAALNKVARPTTPTDNPKGTQYELLSFADLQEIARERKVLGWSAITDKEELIKSIKATVEATEKQRVSKK